MPIPDIIIHKDDHLPVEKFREMDYLAVNEYLLPKTQLARALAFGSEAIIKNDFSNKDLFPDHKIVFVEEVSKHLSCRCSGVHDIS